MKTLKMKIMLIALFIMSVTNSYSQFSDSDSDGFLEISTANQMLIFASNPGFWSTNFELTADINLSGLTLGAIGNTLYSPFNGIFRGWNSNALGQKVYYKISGLTNNNIGDHVGLFGINTGTIDGVTICKFNISGRDQIGGLCGANLGEIHECQLYFDPNDNTFTPSEIKGRARVGGLIGLNAGIVTDCTPTFTRLSNTYANVEGNRYVGGFVGFNDNPNDSPFLNNELINVNVKAVSFINDPFIDPTPQRIGGFVGQNCGYITDSYVSNYPISYSTYDRSIVKIEDNTYEIGGFCGLSYGNISHCSANVKIDVNTLSQNEFVTIVGGFVGYLDSGIVSDCYSRSDITSHDLGTLQYVGGFVGIVDYNGTTARNFVAPNIQGNRWNLDGYSAYSNLDGSWGCPECIYNADFNSNPSASGSGYSSTNCRSMNWYYSTYWDFTNVWELSTNNQGYPSFINNTYYKRNIAVTDNSIDIYPNPVIDKSTISLSDNSGSTTIEVFDITGQKLETIFCGELNNSTKNIVFDGNKYKSGMYYLVMERDNNRITKPIVVTH